jgi:CDP-4-dehydro-6-deoxyglucose reductase/3-phenylpropionate/trans-cinnamate dioxygenase ferredoxin reductase subunit/phenol hydroxylase P5 protein
MLLPATIDAVSTATPRALHVRLRLDTPFAFAPGQAALIGAHGSDERRPYSIAVGPEEAARTGCLEFLIGLAADGVPGPHLPRVEPGERVDVEGPFGTFTFPSAPSERSFLFVAGGSGIAPIRSMLHHALAVDRGWRVSLAYSARVPEELAFDSELRALAESSGLRYYATTTRHTGEGWSGGRTRIDRALLAHCVADPETLCFVCGPESLVHEVPRMLRELGVADARIRVEEWAAASPADA